MFLSLLNYQAKKLLNLGVIFDGCLFFEFCCYVLGDEAGMM